MKFKQFGSFCALAALLSLTGCLERQFAEETTKISVDAQAVIVTSDSDFGTDLIADTIWVSANRSWVADFSEKVDWVSMVEDGHQNFGNVMETVPLILKFKDNLAEQPRSVNLVLSSEAGKQQISVTQTAINYRLAIENDPEDFQNLPYEADTVSISIKSNADWTISVKPESGVKASFSEVSGHGTAEIQMYVEENPDQEAKEGTIVLSSPKCASVEVAMSQLKAKPYLKFPQGDKIAAFDGIDNFAIPIKTNANWSASIAQVIGYDSLKVTTTASGDKTSTEAWVNFPASYDFSLEKASIKVRFTVEGGKTVYATIEQVPALRYCFGNPYTEALHSKKDKLWSSSADSALIHKNFWPFATCVSKSNPEESHGDGFTWLTKGTRHKSDGIGIECTTRNGGYVLHILGGAGQGMTVSASYGISIGSNVGLYLGAPIVPGRKLVKVDFWLHGGSGFYGEVQNMSGAAMSGGKQFKISSSGAYHIGCDLNDTEVGVEYRIGLYQKGYWLRCPDVTFYYE